MYGDYTSEALLGNVLEKKLKEDPNIRNGIQIITKTDICAPVEGKNNYKIQHYDTSYSHIKKAVDQSLRNLKTDYIGSSLVKSLFPCAHKCSIRRTIIALSRSFDGS